MAKRFEQTNWRNFVLIIGGVFSLSALFYIYLYSHRENDRIQTCQDNNLRSFYLGIDQYVRDSDGKFPPVKPSWTLAVEKSSNISITWYMCPSDGNERPRISDPFLPGSTGYWFNGNLSGVSKNRLAFPNSTLLLGEGHDGVDLSNATYSKTSLPPSWLTDTSKPSFRHRGGANYLFADGHVVWLKPDQVTHFGGRKDAFALK